MMETSGKKLKKELGLSNIKYVSITRVLISSYRVYLVFYDTRRPSVPITQRRATHGYMPSMLVREPFKRRPPMTPLIDLESFDGPLSISMFFVVDLAGYLGNPKLLTKKIENVSEPLYRGKLNEFVTLGDLNNASAASDLTKQFRKTRNSLAGTENTLSKLVDSFIDEGDGSITFAFLTSATPYPDEEDHEYGEVDPDSDFSIKRNPSETYELQIKVLDFLSWLDTDPDRSLITPKDIKEILQISNVQVFSTSPSFHWQSMNFNLSQLDASIHPTTIAPTFWNRPNLHGNDAFVDKHLYGLLRSIDFFANQMASSATKKLRDRGLI